MAYLVYYDYFFLYNVLFLLELIMTLLFSFA